MLAKICTISPSPGAEIESFYGGSASAWIAYSGTSDQILFEQGTFRDRALLLFCSWREISANICARSRMVLTETGDHICLSIGTITIPGFTMRVYLQRSSEEKTNCHATTICQSRNVCTHEYSHMLS
jgi:hypothetical protein